MKNKLKEILERAIKTFLQAFMGSLIVTLPNANIFDKSVLTSLLVGGIACGISALMNMILIKEGESNE